LHRPTEPFWRKLAVMPTHAVLWIDHQESRLFHVHPVTTADGVILAPQHHVQRHSKGTAQSREHLHRFFADVARGLDGVDAILLVGPSSAKLEFFRYVQQHERRLEQRVVGIETADHPTDAQLVAQARSYFEASDGDADALVIAAAGSPMASGDRKTGPRR
jgi:stalled ribosome rescue protein Dom34